MAKMFQTNDIKPNTTIIMNGVVQFSHIVRKYKDQELADFNTQQRMRSKKAILKTKPFGRLEISNVEFESPMNAEEKTFIDYLEERCFVKPSAPDKKLNYTLDVNAYDNKKHLTDPKEPKYIFSAIKYLNYNKSTNEYDEFVPTKDFKVGIPVKLVMRCFATNMNNGITIDAILFPEGVQYFASDLQSELKKKGININLKSATDKPQDSSIEETAVEEEDTLIDETGNNDVSFIDSYSYDGESLEGLLEDLDS